MKKNVQYKLKTLNALSSFKRGSELGFTLIELMVVVGIIGTLIAISSTQYDSYRRRAAQSEAKFFLGAAFGLQKSFYSEYSAYIPAFDAFGYEPQGSRRYYHHWACLNDGPYTGSVTGYTGTSAVWTYGRTYTQFALTSREPSHSCDFTQACSTLSLTNDLQYFRMTASGMLCAGCYIDDWQITDQKILRNCSVGLR